MSKQKSSGMKIQWGRLLKKLSPYTIQKGLRYLKHYGPREFWIRLHERFEPEEVPYGPWYEAYIPDETVLEKQRRHTFPYAPKISVVREFDTLKFKKALQSLETGLFFGQIFIFSI